MEPRIQYATTSDGVSIAFSAIGQGPPLVVPPWLTPTTNSIQSEWSLPEFRLWYERLAEMRTVIRFDNRGSGLSERNVTDFSLDKYILDLEAVVDQLALERFALFGSFDSGLIALAYAVRRPEKVSHLVLWCSHARRRDVTALPAIQAVRALREHEWVTYTELVAHIALGWSEGDLAHRYAAIIRESGTREVHHDALQAIDTFDVTDILSQVRSPTLVMHRRESAFSKLEFGRALAAGILGASFLIFEGSSIAPFVGDAEAVAQALSEFLETGEGTPQPAAWGGFQTVLFTDIEGSTALTQRLGDATAREVLRDHERIVREALKSHGGSEVKTMGDGFMASFGSATRALECAVAIQKALTPDPSLVATGDGQSVVPLKIRCGLNAGEPVAEDGPDGRADLFGTAVNMAARIAGQAKGGEILVSNVVRELVAGKGFLFADMGEHVLRGFEDPVRLYEVRW